MSNPIKRWYALYTRPGCEKKVANLLSRRNIENYCPLKRQWNSKKKVVLEPLFCSYVFIQIRDTEIPGFRMTDNVVNFVYWLGKPAEIREEEIEIMKRFLNEYANVKLEKIPFSVDGMVRITGATMEDNNKQMVSVKNASVRVVLPSLGYMMLAEVEQLSNVEIITAAKQGYTTTIEKYHYAI